MDATDMTSAEHAANEWSRKEWEDEQMTLARLDKDTQDEVRRLMNAWRTKTVPEKRRELVLRTFEAFVHGHSLVTSDDPSERWEPATPGRIHGRDVVRVKNDAYADQAGAMHNGRRGRVIAVRYGDIIVKYEDGRQPPFDAVHHAPARLEKLLR
jgi:hypothetical protein